MIRPRELKLEEELGQIVISWMDGNTTRHCMSQLRRDCPCAHCNIERKKLSEPGPVLRVISSEAPTVSEAKVVEFSPVGRYALTFTFNDGHGTGIYTFDFLKKTALSS